MVTANTVVESLATTCRQSNSIPSAVTYATVMLDQDGEHADVSLPIVEFTVDTIERDTSRNTERVGVTTDDAGRETGYRYSQWFDLTATAQVQTVPKTRLTHRELATVVRKVLYRHDTHGPALSLPDPDQPNADLSDVSYIAVGDSEPAHDFAMSPSLRSRSITLDIKFQHEWTSADLGIEYERVTEIDPINIVVES